MINLTIYLIGGALKNFDAHLYRIPTQSIYNSVNIVNRLSCKAGLICTSRC